MWAPYLTFAQVNLESSPFQNLDPEMLETHLKMAMSNHGPLVATNWSVHDIVWTLRMKSLLYVDMKDMIAVYHPLHPDTRCAQSFSRRDVELVATAIAESYNCAF